MKKLVLIIILTLLLTANMFSGNPQINNHKSGPNITFTENKGQVHDQNYQPRPDVLYGVMTGNMAVHIKKTGVSYQLYRVDSYKEVEDPKSREKTKETDQQTIYRIDLNWLNHNENFTTTEDEVLPGYNNYYLESCPEGVLNVRSYKGITLQNLYPGINLHYYEKKGELKYDYIIAPHTDYKQIQIKVEGTGVSIKEDGSLILNTPLGKVQEGAPLVYQNGRQLTARWKIKNYILSFEVENYNSNYELNIDPVTRLWGTYYGGSENDRARACVTDEFRNSYLSGFAQSNTGTIIATSGSHQFTFAGSTDAFITKFNSSGVRLWATYYGGSAGDSGYSCTTDDFGNVYMAGNTSSNAGIASAGAFKGTYGGSGDAFLAKFTSSGTRLWCTYYGGSGDDNGYSCATDNIGNVYMAGSSSSTGTNISTPGSHQAGYGGGVCDAYLVKFSATGVRQWGTYYGGNVGSDIGGSCVIDSAGNIFLAGYAGSSSGNVIATVAAHQPTFGGGPSDGFLVKFNINGARQWGTYYGGSGDDGASSCAIDLNGNIYITGYTDSNVGSGIASTSGHQTVYGGGFLDGFLAKFDVNGLRLWGTYYGGSGQDACSSVDCDENGNVYIAGGSTTGSGTSIASTSSYQDSYGGGPYDAFIAKFNSNGVRQWGTYYGGTGNDNGLSCTVDVSGSIYLAGWTSSTTGTVISSLNGHQPMYGGGTFDAFFVKFDGCDLAPVQPSVINGNASLCTGGGTNNYSTAIVNGANSYTWSLPPNWSGSSNINTISTTPGASGVFTVVAGNSCGVSPQQTLQVLVHDLPAITATSNSALLCTGESATLTADGGTSYTFEPGGAGANISVSPTVTTTYTVTGVDANGCINTATFTQVVEECTSIKENSLAKSGTKIYPNPTNGIITVALDSERDVIIVNAIGQVVYSSKLSAGHHAINLGDFAKGIYVLRVKDKAGSHEFKMIKE